MALLLALPADVQRLLLDQYLCDEDAAVARCACRALRALVPHERVIACRHRLYAHFCTQGYIAALAWSRLLAGERLCTRRRRCANRVQARYARWPPPVDTLQRFSGYASTARRGTRQRARERPKAGTSRCCNGCVQTARRGTSGRVRTRRKAAIYHYCNGAACSQASGCTRQRRAVG